MSLIMRLAHKLGDVEHFGTGCEYFIQEQTGQVIRLEFEQRQALFEFYSVDPDEASADVLAIGLKLPFSMLRYPLYQAKDRIETELKKFLFEPRIPEVLAAIQMLYRLQYAAKHPVEIVDYNHEKMTVRLTEDAETLFRLQYQEQW